MLAERTHDVLIVVFERETEIADLIVEQPRIAEMAAKHIAAEQDALLLDQGALRVRPMQERRAKKV